MYTACNIFSRELILKTKIKTKITRKIFIDSIDNIKWIKDNIKRDCDVTKIKMFHFIWILLALSNVNLITYNLI